MSGARRGGEAGDDGPGGDLDHDERVGGLHREEEVVVVVLPAAPPHMRGSCGSRASCGAPTHERKLCLSCFLRRPHT
jgi:hypothetical protein